MFLTLIRKQLNTDNSDRIVQLSQQHNGVNPTTSDCALKYFYKNWPIDTFVLFLDLLFTQAKNE